VKKAKLGPVVSEKTLRISLQIADYHRAAADGVRERNIKPERALAP
jgi:hypothetical protein